MHRSRKALPVNWNSSDLMQFASSASLASSTSSSLGCSSPTLSSPTLSGPLASGGSLSYGAPASPSCDGRPTRKRSKFFGDVTIDSFQGLERHRALETHRQLKTIIVEGTAEELERLLEPLDFICKPAIINHLDELGRTLLHHACCNALLGHAEVLLRHGADQNLADKDLQNTPAHFAAWSGSLKMLQCLQAHSEVDLTRLNKDKWTPLHFAAAFGDVLMTEWIWGEARQVFVARKFDMASMRDTLLSRCERHDDRSYRRKFERILWPLLKQATSDANLAVRD
ncbi:uncharacterized protein MONBRDRAFT_37356 [Monosiga brevicollis MX1]|uniref:Uncharacterized protein n=1 Tax=Monosiga brevicollis TaxID=81824 RepID=A9V168_MONBE|nr:uncharacterized protein MONBRDRAFT_37356 [Monosiga brevicollis MX1]EDQ88878.1 predicted protein [Monosiga brevicollis MX1]|eukprot:XP_001746491.1 hypothetical protein [Monosiga brevicollis MX1]